MTEKKGIVRRLTWEMYAFWQDHSEGVVLRTCGINSESSQPVKVKESTILEEPSFNSHLTCSAALIEARAGVNESNVVRVTPSFYHPSFLRKI